MKGELNTSWVCDKYIPNIGRVCNYDESDGSYEVRVGSSTDSLKTPSSVPLPQNNNSNNDIENQDHSSTANSSVPASGHIQHSDEEHS